MRPCVNRPSTVLEIATEPTGDGTEVRVMGKGKRVGSPMEDGGKFPVRYSRRFSNELVENARRLFERRMGRPLTNEEARQML